MLSPHGVVIHVGVGQLVRCTETEEASSYSTNFYQLPLPVTSCFIGVGLSACLLVGFYAETTWQIFTELRGKGSCGPWKKPLYFSGNPDQITLMVMVMVMEVRVPLYSACKTLSVGLLVVTIWLELCTSPAVTTTSIIPSFIKTV